MKYDRLTERVDSGFVSELDCRIAYNKLSAIEDKIEQGTLIELPCKVGDIFYYANQLKKTVEKHKITAIEFSCETRIRTICSRSTTDTYIGYFLPSYYGKTIFLTREEAEKRLKELKK